MALKALCAFLAALTLVSAQQINLYSDTECKNYVTSHTGGGTGKSHNSPTFYGFRGVDMPTRMSSYMATNDGNCKTSNGKYYTGTGGATGTTPCHGYSGGFNCWALEFVCSSPTCD